MCFDITRYKHAYTPANLISLTNLMPLSYNNSVAPKTYTLSR